MGSRKCKPISSDDVHKIIDNYKYGIDKVLLSRLLRLSFSESEDFMRTLMRAEPNTIFINIYGTYITKENRERAIASGTKM